jgi:integral membrane sensor domain MASE1
MNRIIHSSRIVLLGLAFVVVMAGTGALLGAIAGVILMLLTHAVMGMSTEMVALMPTSIALGALAATSFGLFLMARQAVTFTWQPRLVSAPHSDHK